MINLNYLLPCNYCFFIVPIWDKAPLFWSYQPLVHFSGVLYEAWNRSCYVWHAIYSLSSASLRRQFLKHHAAFEKCYCTWKIQRDRVTIYKKLIHKFFGINWNTYLTFICLYHPKPPDKFEDMYLAKGKRGLQYHRSVSTDWWIYSSEGHCTPHLTLPTLMLLLSRAKGCKYFW